MNVVYIYLAILDSLVCSLIGYWFKPVADCALGLESKHEISRLLLAKFAMEVKGLSHWFGSYRVLNDVNLKILAGQIVALVGPSGCEKARC